MRRTRPKGDSDPGWVRITWDEALTEIAERLRTIREESGAEAVAFGVTTLSGTPVSDSIEWIERFVRIFGSPNLVYGTELCNFHKDFAHAFTFGCSMPAADYANSDLIMLWGHNPASTWLAQAEAIARGRASGAKLLVVDPRETGLAKEADHWLRVRPGTDTALALGLSNLLIANNTFDADFVRTWTNAPLLVRRDTGRFLRERDCAPRAAENRYMIWDAGEGRARPYDPSMRAERPERFALRGDYDAGARCRPAFDVFAEHCAAFTPERVEQITWVPAQELIAAAETLAQSRRIAYHAWTGIGQHANATQMERAVATMYALTGSFDRRGGNVVYNRQPTNAINRFDLLPPEQRAKALGLREHPLGPPRNGSIPGAYLYRAILEGKPYRVRAFVAFGINLLLSQAAPANAAAAFERLDFYVHCDLFETPTARDADIVLPVNSPWEHEGLRAGFEISAQACDLVQLRQRMVTPRGESRADYEIVFDLAKRLGMSSEFFGGEVDAGWNHILQPLGITVDDLRRRPEGIRLPLAQSYEKYAGATNGGVRGFATDTGRVELYSELLLRHGYPALPTFEEPESIDPDGGFPLVLTCAKNGYFCHSQHRNLTSLRRRALAPVAEISADLAAVRDIREGEMFAITTRAGRAQFVAKFNRSLHPRVVVAEFGWWQACPGLGQPGFSALGEETSNYNALIDTEHVDPLSGSVPHRSFACDIARDGALAKAPRLWSGWRKFCVAQLSLETPDVAVLELEALDGATLPDFHPGQYVTVRAAGFVRSYSLIGPAAENNRWRYRIAVKRIGGMMSRYVHETLRTGDEVELRVPNGRFIVPRNADSPIVLIAAGIGITPFLSYLESLDGMAITPHVTLHYVNRNSASHAFRKRISELKKRVPHLNVINYYSRPFEDDKQGMDFDAEGRPQAGLIATEAMAENARFYLCGPQSMIDGFTAALLMRGVPKFEIFKEIFQSPVAAIGNGHASFKVKFARSGVDGIWKSEYGSLLEFGERLGVALPSGCRVGQCESCNVRVVSGGVRYLSAVGDDDEHDCIACQAVPSTDLVLDA